MMKPGQTFLPEEGKTTKLVHQGGLAPAWPGKAGASLLATARSHKTGQAGQRPAASQREGTLPPARLPARASLWNGFGTTVFERAERTGE